MKGLKQTQEAHGLMSWQPRSFTKPSSQQLYILSSHHHQKLLVVRSRSRIEQQQCNLSLICRINQVIVTFQLCTHLKVLNKIQCFIEISYHLIFKASYDLNSVQAFSISFQFKFVTLNLLKIVHQIRVNKSQTEVNMMISGLLLIETWLMVLLSLS